MNKHYNAYRGLCTHATPAVWCRVVAIDQTVPVYIVDWLNHHDDRVCVVNMSTVQNITGESKAVWRLMLMAGWFVESPMRFVAMDVDTRDHQWCMNHLQRALTMSDSTEDTAYFHPIVSREWVVSASHGFRIASDFCDVIFDVIRPTVWRSSLQRLLTQLYHEAGSDALTMTHVFSALTHSTEPIFPLHDRDPDGYGVDEVVLTQYLMDLDARHRIPVKPLYNVYRGRRRPYIRVQSYGAYRREDSMVP